MAESSNTDMNVFGLKVKLRPLLILCSNHKIPWAVKWPFFDYFVFRGFLQASDILLPHPSSPNSFCLGPRSYEKPIDLISCEANRIPFVSQNIDLDSWSDSLRAWPNPPEGWVTWYNRWWTPTSLHGNP
jgi:hypothetical protein